MSQQRILIVDDDANLREALRIWLAKANFEVVVASNGSEALQILRESESMDLVLTDFMMPELNGIELVRLVKASTALCDTPVVVMSNNTDPEFRKRAIELGATAFLLKTDGARTLAEKAIQKIGGRQPLIAPVQAQPSNAQIHAMQQSLLALIGIAAQTDGLPTQAKSALTSAEKLAESLFAGVPE